MPPNVYTDTNGTTHSVNHNTSAEVKPDEVICSSCEEITDDYQESIEVDGETKEFLCDSCQEDIYQCDDCGCSMWSESNYLRLTENGDSYCEDCYYEIYSTCDTCELEHTRDELHWSDSNEEYYCEQCYQGEEEVDLDSYSQRNMGEDARSNRIIKSMRLVGLEVETITKEWNYWDCEDTNHPETFRPVHDGSIDRGEGGSGVEWVMRNPSNGDELYNRIANLTEYLSSDFDVNRSCGLHVHVDARDCEWKQLKHILLLGKAVQDVIYKMLPPSRDNGRWCRRIPMSRSDILAIESNDEFIDAWYNSWGVDPSMEKYNDSRYCGMNMHSRIINGSVEFRYHSGTINQDKILNWTKICTAIVDTGIEISKGGVSAYRSAEILDILINRDLTYEEFFKYLRLDSDVREYVDQRMAKFYDKNKAEDYEVLEYSV
tara:strand:- start:8042 stop:9334 length:1293 start_codon:yes stop_codon:yes gene_type:complete